MNEFPTKVKTRCKKLPNGCIVWLGAKTTAGYGQVILNKKQKYLHRLSFEIYKGEIPKDFVVDHVCNNPSCFNPEHLRLLTSGENVSRGTNKFKDTHCKNGHEYVKSNIFICPKGYRKCRKCRYNNVKKFRANLIK